VWSSPFASLDLHGSARQADDNGAKGQRYRCRGLPTTEVECCIKSGGAMSIVVATFTRPACLRSMALAVLGTMLALTPLPAFAAEVGFGTYFLGARGAFAGIVPGPGVYYQHDVLFYRGDIGANVALPYASVIAAGIKADAVIQIPTLTWVSQNQIFGGNFGVAAAFPFGRVNVDAAAQLSSPLLTSVIATNVHDSSFTIGDPYLTAFVGWHAGNLHWNAGFGFNAPVGQYNANRLANLAFHRTSFDPYGAVTWFDPQIGIDLSGAVGVTFNLENPATNYRTGTEFHMEWAVVKVFSNGFSFGLIGYHYQQLTGDSGSGAVFGPFKGRVTALGGTIAYNFKLANREISTRVKILKEFNIVNRLDGTIGVLSLAVPLTTPHK
jgi:hypothetical protein